MAFVIKKLRIWTPNRAKLYDKAGKLKIYFYFITRMSYFFSDLILVCVSEFFTLETLDNYAIPSMSVNTWFFYLFGKDYNWIVKTVLKYESSMKVDVDNQ